MDPYWILLEHEQKMAEEGDAFAVEKVPDEEYLQKMEDILGASPCIGVPPDPSLIMPNVYIGTQANAENLQLLKRMKITHVLNCAAPPSVRGVKESTLSKRYPKESGITYLGLRMDDSEYYDIRRDFRAAHAFISKGRMSGRVLIHCSGVSRCGAICLSYMVKSGMPLLRATQDLKNARRVALCNRSFMRTLVEYARDLRLLDVDVHEIRAPKFGRRIDRHRMLSAHLPNPYA